MAQIQTRRVATVTRAASPQPATLDREARTVRVRWTTGARRRTWSWEDGEVDEELDLAGADLSAWDGAPVLDTHDASSALRAIGVVQPGTTTRGNGYIESDVRFARTDEGERALELVADGIVTQWSVGYDEIAYQRTDAKARKPPAEVPLYRAVRWRPRELSAVPIGADPNARTRSGEECSLTIEEIDMEDRQQAAPAVTTEPAPEAQVVDLAAVRAAAVAEYTKRCDDIALAARVCGVEADAKALAATDRPLDVIRAEFIAQAAKAQEATATRGTHFEAGTDDSEKRAGAMVASLLHRARPSVDKFRSMDGSKVYRGSVIDMLRSELMARGASRAKVDGLTKSQVWSEAMRSRSGQQHTTTDLPYVFLDAINKSLNEAYEAAPSTYRTWARQSNYRDFRDHYHIALSGLPVPPKKVEGANYEKVALSDERNSSRASTYAYRIDYTREMAVNDDLNAFGMLAEEIGESFSYNEDAITYGLLSTNGNLADGVAFFDAAHGNIATSFGKPGATLAEHLAERTFTGLDGRPRPFDDRFIIVPRAYRWEAEQYYLSQWTPAVVGETRPAAASGRVVVDTVHLATGAWYAAMANSGVVWGFLEGQEGVTTESADLWDADVVSVRARSDFGAGVKDFRRIVKIFETDPS